MDEIVGETASLRCNTSLTADIMWTYDAGNDGYVQYVYWNSHVDDDRPRLGVNITDDEFHNLIISRLQLTDQGRYDCYDSTGLRSVGYQLTVAGTHLSIAML